MSIEDKAFFLSWCIEEYAAVHNVLGQSAAAMFEEKGVLQFLERNAEILHTQGKDFILSEIDAFCGN